ncbi:MAG: hypothetical protein KF777_13345 [Planctomycetaceae bacterium]|nr:hypothetical protein [Planctomycetaceae bacterium]
MIDERVTLKTNSQGYPIIVRSGERGIEVLISEDAENGTTDIELIGDEASLRCFGEVLIGVSKAKGYHVHLEANAETSPLDIEPNNIRITVSNRETPEQRKPSSLPPDWARG